MSSDEYLKSEITSLKWTSLPSPDLCYLTSRRIPFLSFEEASDSTAIKLNSTSNSKSVQEKFERNSSFPLEDATSGGGSNTGSSISTAEVIEILSSDDEVDELIKGIDLSQFCNL